MERMVGALGDDTLRDTPEAELEEWFQALGEKVCAILVNRFPTNTDEGEARVQATLSDLMRLLHAEMESMAVDSLAGRSGGSVTVRLDEDQLQRTLEAFIRVATSFIKVSS